MLPRSRVDDQPVRTRARTVRLGVGAVALGWLLRTTARVVVVISTTPPALVTVAVLAGLVWLGLLTDVVVALTVAVFGQAGLIIWWRQSPSSFYRWVGRPVWSWGRDWLVYRPRWGSAVKASRLTQAWNAHD